MQVLWLTLGYLCALFGFGCLALAMEAHWQQVRAASVPARRQVLLLRLLGVIALAGSLAACLRADHGTMAALVWVMLLTAAALSVAFALSWRPRLLAPLTIWIRTAPVRPASR